MQSNTKKFLLLSLLSILICAKAHADGYMIPKTVDICCDGANMTEEQCCETMRGFWCEQEKKCYASINLGVFTSSACMTPELCESREGDYGNDKYCEGNHTCYLSEDYYSACPDVDEPACIAANKNTSFWYAWCNNPAKCFGGVQGDFIAQCHDDPATVCNKTFSYRWCYYNSTCYGNITYYFYPQCAPKISEESCKTQYGETNHWCAKQSRCYYDTRDYNAYCK